MALYSAYNANNISSMGPVVMGIERVLVAALGTMVMLGYAQILEISAKQSVALCLALVGAFMVG